MTARPDDLFTVFARSLAAMGRSVGQEIDGAIGRAVHGLREREGEREQAAAGLTVADQLVVDQVDELLARGLDLKRWWDRVWAEESFAERFELGRTFNEADRSFGFFDHAEVDGRRMAVMGNFQEMFYDWPKAPRDSRGEAARWMRDQIRQFVLRYFMRVSDYRQPEGFAGRVAKSAAGCLGPLSWCPAEDVARQGFGFQQLFYKLRETGEVGKFPAAERFAIVDLREIGPVYEWIVVKVTIFDFNLELRPFGQTNQRLVVPLAEDSYLVLTRDFIVDKAEPAPEVLGAYGLGYAFLKNPQLGALAFGPGQFEAAVECIDFEVRCSGETRVAMTFICNRPERLLRLAVDPVSLGLRAADLMSLGFASRLLGPLSGPRVELDPVYAYVDLANLATGGAAARDLCISREQLDKEFLLKHFMQHYQTIAGSLATWRRVPDWLDESQLPAWAIQGSGSR